MRGERGKHVLDRVHAHRAFADRGRALDRFQVRDRRVDRRLVLQILAFEFDPGSTGAGWILSVTFAPVCSEVPLTEAVFGERMLEFGGSGHEALTNRRAAEWLEACGALI